eukprot:SAG31_NODE_9156_length_1324_cov_2.200816_1_plen_77_part_00
MLRRRQRLRLQRQVAANMLFYGAVLAAGVLLLTLAVPAPMTWGLWLGLRVVLAVSSAAALAAAAAAALAARRWRKM